MCWNLLISPCLALNLSAAANAQDFGALFQWTRRWIFWLHLWNLSSLEGLYLWHFAVQFFFSHISHKHWLLPSFISDRKKGSLDFQMPHKELISCVIYVIVMWYLLMLSNYLLVKGLEWEWIEMLELDWEVIEIDSKTVDKYGL